MFINTIVIAVAVILFIVETVVIILLLKTVRFLFDELIKYQKEEES